MKRYLLKQIEPKTGRVVECDSYESRSEVEAEAFNVSYFTANRAVVYDNATDKYLRGIWEVA